MTTTLGEERGCGDRLADYTQQRAKSPCGSPTSSAILTFEGGSLGKKAPLGGGGDDDARSSSKKMHDAISATEFLLSLPLEGIDTGVRDGDDDSCNSSLSSLGSSFMLSVGGESLPATEPGQLSCSDRLRLSMKTLVKQNSGKDMQFSFSSLKSNVDSLARQDGTSEKSSKKRSVRRSTSADSVLSQSSRSLASLMCDDSEDANDVSEISLNQRRQKSSIKFPLRRSLSNGERFERTPSQRSLNSTDRLRRSLSKEVAIGKNNNSATGGMRVRDCDASEGGGTTASSIKIRRPPKKTNSAGAIQFGLQLRRSGSMQKGISHDSSMKLPLQRRSTHTGIRPRVNARPTRTSPIPPQDDTSVCTAKNSVNTAKSSVRTAKSSKDGSGQSSEEQERTNRRRARRRRSRNAILDGSGRSQLSPPPGKITVNSPGPARAPPKVVRRVSDREVVVEGAAKDCWITHHKPKDECEAMQKELFSSLSKPARYRRTVSDPSRYMQEAKDREGEGLENGVPVSLTFRSRRPRKQLSADSTSDGSKRENAFGELKRKISSGSLARMAPERREPPSKSRSCSAKDFARTDTAGSKSPFRRRNSMEATGKLLDLSTNALLANSMHKPSKGRRISRAERLSIREKQEEEEKQLRNLENSTTSLLSTASATSSYSPARDSSKLAQLASMTRGSSRTKGRKDTGVTRSSTSNSPRSPNRSSRSRRSAPTDSSGNPVRKEPALMRSSTSNSLRTFQASSRNLRSTTSGSSSNLVRNLSNNDILHLAAKGMKRGSSSQVMIPGVTRVISNSSNKNMMSEEQKTPGKNAEWTSASNEDKVKRPVVNPFLSMVNKAPGTPSTRPKPTKVKSLLKDSSSKRLSLRRSTSMDDSSSKKRSTRLDDSSKRRRCRRTTSMDDSSMKSNHMDASSKRRSTRTGGLGDNSRRSDAERKSETEERDRRRANRRHGGSGSKTIVELSGRMGSSTATRTVCEADHDDRIVSKMGRSRSAGTLSSRLSDSMATLTGAIDESGDNQRRKLAGGRPTLQRSNTNNSQKDLVAELNAKLPSKVLVLESIKTGSTRNMGCFVTGSRIRRYNNVEELKNQHSLHT